MAILLSAGKMLYQLCCVQWLLMEFNVVVHMVNTIFFAQLQTMTTISVLVNNYLNFVY